MRSQIVPARGGDPDLLLNRETRRLRQRSLTRQGERQAGLREADLGVALPQQPDDLAARDAFPGAVRPEELIGSRLSSSIGRQKVQESRHDPMLTGDKKIANRP